MRNLLITGGAGFIGFNYLKYFYSLGWWQKYDKVVNLDKMGYATQYNLDEYAKLEVELKRVTNFQTLQMTAHDFGVTFAGSFDKDLSNGSWDILDFASESHVDNSIKNPAELYKENSRIPSDILAAFGSLKSIHRYYHISTDEVYGDLPIELRGVTSTYFTTTSQFKPSNPYSASKVAQDAYMHAIAKTFKLPVSFIRMANQFGPWQHPEKMVPASILRALRGESIKIYGKGKNCRQWTYVADTVSIINRVLNRDPIFVEKDELVETYHLADMENLMDNNSLAWEIKRSLLRYGITPNIEYIEDRLGHDMMYALSVPTNIAKQYIHNFRYTLDLTVDSYLERFRNGEFS